MIGHTKLLSELGWLVKRSRADTTMLYAEADTRRVSRFAYDAIHQDLAQESVSVYVKIIVNRRVGVAVTDTLERAALLRCLGSAMEIARHAPPLKEVPPLPRNHRQIVIHGEATPADRPSSQIFLTELKRLFQICQGVGARLAGSFMTGDDERAAVNSSGVASYAASTVAGAKLVTMYRSISGFASAVARKPESLHVEDLLERALKQCLHRQEPVTLPTGVYDVILEPEAVAELMTWLGYIAFGAKSVQERTSFLSGRMGEQVMGRGVTIADDGLDPEGLPIPFDAEGTPKQKAVFIDRGKAAGFVYDTTYGHLYAHPSTGHALPPDEVEGPLPLNLFMEPGTKRREELIRSCPRGLLIPRFHYVNGLLNPREALMTGLTREGASLIEDGKLKAPITTMRFTQSMLEAFSHVVGISKERQLIADPAQESGCAVMPTVRLAKFRFTGRSEE